MSAMAVLSSASKARTRKKLLFIETFGCPREKDRTLLFIIKFESSGLSQLRNKFLSEKSEIESTKPTQEPAVTHHLTPASIYMAFCRQELV